MVLVPGFACAPNVWFKVRESLSSEFELHLVTVPGFGGMSRVEAPVMPKVIEALGRYSSSLDNPVLIGHSFGGTLTLGVAARFPNVLKGGVVVDGLPYSPTVFDVNATVESMRERAEQLRDEILNASPPVPGQPTYFDEHIMDPTDAAYMNETTPGADRSAMADMRFEGMTVDLRPEMPNIRAPVLVMGAGQPWLKSPGDLEGIRTWYLDRLVTIARLDLRIAERARHFVMIDDPDWFVSTLTEFITSFS